jgi:hypothetical protein
VPAAYDGPARSVWVIPSRTFPGARRVAMSGSECDLSLSIRTPGLIIESHSGTLFQCRERRR